MAKSKKSSDTARIRSILLGDLEKDVNKRFSDLEKRLIALEKKSTSDIQKQDLLDLQQAMQNYLIKVLDERSGRDEIAHAFVAFGEYLKKSKA